jgi:hypothetical protein
MRNAALPEQFDEIQPPEAELTGGAASRHLTVREKGEDGLLAEMFFELLFVYRLLGNIDLDLKFHGNPIVLSMREGEFLARLDSGTGPGARAHLGDYEGIEARLRRLSS